MEGKELDEFVVFLHQIENEIDTEKFKVNGVDYWPRVRCTIWMNYRQSYLSKEKKTYRTVEKDFRNKLLSLFRSFCKGHLFYLFRFRKLRKSDILFFGDVSSLRNPSEVQGIYNDNFFDPLIRKFSGKRSVFIIRQNFAFLRPIKGLNDYHVMGLDFLLYSLKALLVFRKFRFPLEFIQELDRIRCNYDNIIDFIPTLNYLSRHIRMSHSFSSLMLKYLKLVDPKFVFVTHYNSHLSTSMIYAAKTLGIPVVDVQHGVINHLHPTYSFINQNIFKLNSIPHAFIINDKTSFDVLAKWVSFKRIHALSNSNEDPSLKYKSKLGSIFFESIETNLKSRKLILITLSWENGISDLIVEIVNRSSDIAYFVIRLHPSTSLIEEKNLKKILQRKLFQRNYNIHCAKEVSLDLLLEMVDLHITECSTVVIEALKFGKRSIVVSQMGLEYYNDLVQSGIILFSRSTLELLNYLSDENTYLMDSRMSILDSIPKINLDFDLFIKELENVKNNNI
jgi:hypothetical protein